MTDIALPDGTVGRFPDDMPDGEIQAILMKQFPPETPAPSTTEDVAKSFGTGVAKGTAGLATTVPLISQLLEKGADYLFQPILGPRPQGVPGPSPLSDAAVQAGQDVASAATGGYQPQTQAGKYAQSAGEFVPASVAGPLGLAGKTTSAVGVGRGLLGAIGGGVGSEFAGEQAAPYGPAAEIGARILGGAVGGALPAVPSRFITPNPVKDTQRLPLLALADKEGIPLTAGQRSGSKPLQWFESILGDTPFAGGKAEAAREAEHRAYTSNIMEKAGAEPGTLATPGELADTKKALQDTYKDIYSKNSMDLTNNQFGQDLRDVANNYDSRVAVHQQSPIVAKEINKFINTPGATMSGDHYQTWRTKLQGEIDKASGPEATALQELRDAVDANMARSLSPEDAARLADTQRKYAVYKTAEKVANRVTEGASHGYLDPRAVDREVSSWNQAANATGKGPLADIAQVGTGLLGPLPQSGTGPRTHAMSLATQGAGVLASIFGLGAANPDAWKAAAASIGGPAILGRTLMSSPAQWYLGNQAMTNAGLARLAPTIPQGLLTSYLGNRDQLPPILAR